MKKTPKINKSLLHPGYSRTKKEGHYAEFYPDGQLKHFGYYPNGSSIGNWLLTLAHGKEEGQAVRLNADGSIQEGYIFKDGAEKYVYGRGLDRHVPISMPFLKFVRHWITEIRLLDRKGETEAERKNFPTEDECRRLDLNVRKLRVGMSPQEFAELTHRNGSWRENLGAHQVVKGRDNVAFESEYLGRHDYGLRYWVNLEASPPHIRDFEIFGDGWSKETWEIVEKNRKQKPLAGQQ